MAKKKKYVKIQRCWQDAERIAEVLGKPVMVGGQLWTPIVFIDEEDPEFFKTAALEPVKGKLKINV